MNQHARDQGGALPIDLEPEPLREAAASPLVRLWPIAVILVGIAVNVAWIGFLGWLVFYAIAWAARG